MVHTTTSTTTIWFLLAFFLFVSGQSYRALLEFVCVQCTYIMKATMIDWSQSGWNVNVCFPPLTEVMGAARSLT